MLSPQQSAKLADPAMKQAIQFWVGECVLMMGRLRSEREIKLFLRRKFKSSSPQGINYIFKLAQMEFYKSKHGTYEQN